MLLSVDRFAELETQHLGRTSPQILAAIFSAESVIAGYLGFNPLSGQSAPSMDRGTRVEYFDGVANRDGTPGLWLSIVVVESVASIKADDTTTWGSFGTTVTSTDYALAAEEGAIFLNPNGATSWRRTRGTRERFYKVEYVGGWTQGSGQSHSVPPAVEQAIASVASSMLRGGLNSPVDSTSLGGMSVQVTRRWITDEVRALLSVFRQPSAFMARS